MQNQPVYAGVSLSEEEENRIIKIVKQIKDSDIDEEQLRSAVTKAYDKLEEMGIGKEEVKGILQYSPQSGSAI